MSFKDVALGFGDGPGLAGIFAESLNELRDLK
jgi:hypothetical protein